MSERMRPEVEKMLREVVGHGYGLSDDEAEDLFAELDAVRLDRDEKEAERDAWKINAEQYERERDELREQLKRATSGGEGRVWHQTASNE